MFIDQLSEGSELTLTACFGLKTAGFPSKAAGIYYPKDKKEILEFLDEHNIKKRQKKLVWRFIPQKTPSAANIIIAILLFPIWITIFSLVASIFLIFISLIFSFVISILASFVGGILLIFKAPFYLIYEKNIAYCLDTLGFGFIITGIGLIGIYYLLKSLKKVRKNGWSFKKMFVKVSKKEVYINE